VPAVMHRVLYEEPDLTGVPSSLLPAVRQCLTKDPARRPSARDLLIQLVDPSAPLPVQAAAVPLLTPDSPRSAPTGSQYPPYSTGSQHPSSQYPSGQYPPSSQTSQFAAGSQYTPTGLTPPVRSSRRSGGRIAALSGAAVLVVALAVVITLLATHKTPPSTDHGTSFGAAAASTPATTAPATPISTTSASTTPTDTSSPAGTTTPASSGAATPAAGATIPATFAGTWSGTATMSALSDPGVGLQSSITFTFVTGATTIHEVNGDCVNTLTLTARTDTVLTFSEPQTAACVAGTVTFTRRVAGLTYRWTDNVEQNVAILRRA
jgi:eukaryotic-like serine/threonine-protein kinase